MASKKMRFSSTVQVVGLALIVLLLIPGLSDAAEKKKDRFFDITLMCPIGNLPREKTAQIIARDLEKIGIGVNLRYFEFAAMTPRWKNAAKTGAIFDEGGYDMYLTRTTYSAFPDPSGVYVRYACDQFYPEGNNRVRYCNPEFDKLIYKALGIVNDKERWEVARQAIRIMREDLASIPLFRPSVFYTVRKDVKFPKDRDTLGWESYSLRWAKREIPGKTKEQMSLRERTLILYQPSDIEGFLDGYTGSGYSERASDHMAFSKLIYPVSATYVVGPKEERGVKPDMAESWDISEDGKIWTVKLKKNIYWHDGEKFTADDVVFTFDLINNKAAGYSSNKFIRKNGITWEKIDDYTVRFTSKKFNPLFPAEVLDSVMLPEHLLGKIPPKDIAKSKYHTSMPVGTGPFVLDEYRPAEYLKYKANDKYYGGRPWFDYVVIKFVPQAATSWFAVKTGEADIVDPYYGFTRELKEIESSKDLYAIMQSDFGSHTIRVNNAHPILKNVLIKQAISLACNRKAMVDVISDGLGSVSDQHVPSWSPAFSDDLPPLKYNLDEAKRMMIKAGYNYDDILVDGPKGK